MLLNAEQILSAPVGRTTEVDVPEWGEGAKVLVGTMGGLARMRFLDWLDTLGREPEAEEPGDGEVFTCDSAQPPDAEAKSTRARCEQLTRALQGLMAAVRAGKPQEKIDRLLARADEAFKNAELAKVYTREEDYRVTLRWCAECILDPGTKRAAFTLEKLEELGSLDPAPLYRIAAAAQDLNGLGPDAAADLEKNSERTPGDSSGSG